MSRYRSRLIALVTLCLASPALAGCGSSDDEQALELASGDAPAVAISGCEEQSYALCDIRDPQCQEQHLALAACVRGSDRGQLPPIATISPDEYATRLNDEIAADPPPDPNHWENGLVLLGLAQPGAFAPDQAVAEEVANVAGFYRHEQKDVTIVDRGEPMDDLESNMTLLHEFVHVLQDRDVDLGAYMDSHATGYDSFLAAKSVVEGEARLHETRLRAAFTGLDVNTLDWRERFQHMIGYSDDWMLEQTTPYSAAYYSFPYAYGARYMNFAWEAGHLDGVFQTFANPPPSALALMLSETAMVTPDSVRTDFAAPLAPAELELFGESVLGALGVEFFLLHLQSVAGSNIEPAMLGWRGDHLWIYRDASETTYVVWKLGFADGAGVALLDAEQRQLALSSNSTHLTLATTATDIVLVAASVPGVAFDWAQY